MQNFTQVATALAMWLASVTLAAADDAPTNPNYVTYPEPSMIQRDLGALGRVYRRNYDKFITYTAPNGGAVLLVATDDISDEQLLRAYNILGFYLTDVPGSLYGADKSAVANAMAENGAVLVMPGGADGDSPIWPWALAGQPLYQLEFPTEGSAAYINNDYAQRDAGFEEIFHLVHDYGIGTRFTDGALKASYQVDLAEATADALNNGRWGIMTEGEDPDWIEELRREGSLQQEYIVSVIDSYYGLWAPWKEAPGGMWGSYVAKTRKEVEARDPLGASTLRKFLSDDLTYMARIDPGFEGTFQMQLDPDTPYTHKSQYLRDARLLGDKNSGLSGNARDNVLIGNAGNNTLDGGDGFDVVQIAAASGAVMLRTEGKDTIISGPGLGTDTLRNVELLRFTDRDVPLK